jgi:hypothetical protein
MTEYRGHSYRIVRRHNGWFAEVFLDGVFLFVTGTPSPTRGRAAASARELIERLIYGEKQMSDEW